MIKKGVCTVYTAGGCDVSNYCTKSRKSTKAASRGFCIRAYSNNTTDINYIKTYLHRKLV
ncbi:hypothetical protein CKK33_05895 [Mucilaginibacter sp. MD40]|nr:hypothetical protein CKK33_05895 [Mucilaginibacter sp. MD40]